MSIRPFVTPNEKNLQFYLMSTYAVTRYPAGAPAASEPRYADRPPSSRRPPSTLHTWRVHGSNVTRARTGALRSMVSFKLIRRYTEFSRLLLGMADQKMGFVAARAYTRKLCAERGVDSQAKWTAFSRSGDRPCDTPGNHHQTYKGKGRLGYDDWFGKPAAQVSRVFSDRFLNCSDAARRAGGAKRPPSSHELERMSGTVSRVGCAHSDPLAVLTLLARPVLCAREVVAFAFASPEVAVVIL